MVINCTLQCIFLSELKCLGDVFSPTQVVYQLYYHSPFYSCVSCSMRVLWLYTAEFAIFFIQFKESGLYTTVEEIHSQAIVQCDV